MNIKQSAWRTVFFCDSDESEILLALQKTKTNRREKVGQFTKGVFYGKEIIYL